MITNNFKILMSHIAFGSTATGSSTPAASSYTVTQTNGTSQTQTTSPGPALNMFINSLSHSEKSTSATYGAGYTTIRVGTGTTAPTSSDYELEAITTELTVDSITNSITTNNTNTYTAIVSNPTNADIQLREIGLYTNIWSREYLLDRTVLTTPITIPAGESKPITYEIGF